MKAYILSIAGVILISSVVSMISPSGKMGKFVRGMTKVFIIVVLVAPFASLLSGKGTLLQTAEIEYDDRFLNSYSGMLSAQDEEEIRAWLESEYHIDCDVAVSRSSDDFSYQKVTVRVKDFGIIGEESHIDILSDIQARLAQKYGCETEVS